MEKGSHTATIKPVNVLGILYRNFEARNQNKDRGKKTTFKLKKIGNSTEKRF